ncbi:MAG: TIGR02757 family protein [Campylobacteraceae bacterium]
MLNKNLIKVKNLLDVEVAKKNSLEALLVEADPLRVAKPKNDEFVAFICALFAYGNAKLIEKFLLSLDFSLLDEGEKNQEKNLQTKYYRFQSSQDVVELFKTISRLKKEGSLEDIFLEGYKKEENVLDGINSLISKIYSLNTYSSRGYEFLFGKTSQNPTSTHKRVNMFLRWMVRDDALDMGLWKRVKKSSLLMPLDVHTFNVSKKLGLLNRKSYDFKAVLELTETLKSFDKDDPIKYDFAIYRLGQSKEIENLLTK